MEEEKKLSKEQMETAREGRRLIISQEALETEGKLMDEGDFNHNNFANPGENMWDQQEQSEFNGNHEVNEEDINSRKNRMHAKVDSENVSDRLKRIINHDFNKDNRIYVFEYH